MPRIPEAGRTDKRVPRMIAVQLVCENQPLGAELAFTENVSFGGARIRAHRARNPGEHLVLQSLPGDLQSVARVAYCRRLSPEEFVIGLQFLEPSGEWIIEAASNPRSSLKHAGKV